MPSLSSLGAVTDRIEAALTPAAGVDGVVESKVVLGRRDGEVCGVVLAHEDACNVGDRAFADAFDGRHRPITVGESVASRLDDAYDDVTFELHLTLTTADELNGLDAGRTVAYRATREQFDATATGDRVRAIVTRRRRLKSIGRA